MTATPLTRDDILALRKSSSVAFHHYDGRGYMRAYVKGHGDPVIYSAADQRLYPLPHVLNERYREINTDTDMYGYTGNGFESWNLDSDPKASAFHLVHNNRPEHMTIFNLLRTGDLLTLKWVGGNNNDNNKGIGWQRDELRLIVTRGDKKHMAFFIEAQTGPDNSARMISRYGR